MVNPAKLPVALYAVHMILVRARYLAGEGTDPQKLYQILDWAEILPSLIACREEDTTAEFRAMLSGLGEQFPEFAGFVQNFDNDISWHTNGQPT